MSIPTLSVTLTNYNYERYIAQAIESILNQSFEDFELIILDNASTDRSPEIIRSYAARDQRIRAVFHPHNIGAQQNLIASCELARGRYRMHLDADDWLLSADACQRMVDVLEQHPEVAFVYPMITDFDASGQEMGVMRAYERDAVLPAADALEQILRFYVPHSGTTARMSALRAAGGYDSAFSHCDDLKLWVDLCAHGAVAYLDQPLLARRLHQGQMTSYNVSFREQELARVVESLFASPFGRSLPRSRALRRRLLGEVLTAYPTGAIFSGNYRDGWRSLLKNSIRYPDALLTHKQTALLLARTLLGSSGLWAAQRMFTRSTVSTTTESVPTGEPRIAADVN